MPVIFLTSGTTYTAALTANVLQEVMIDNVYGRLTVRAFVGRDAYHRDVWKCECECGQCKEVTGKQLRRGTKSCGCLRRDNKARTTHGQAPKANHNKPTQAYTAWVNMRRRCDDAYEKYHRYGARGITYDPAWSSFSQFYADMGDPPQGTSLDRINNDGNYCKDNCRWTDATTQARNTSPTVSLTWNGETLLLLEWAARLGINQRTLKTRLRAGWDVQRALTQPVRDRGR